MPAFFSRDYYCESCNFGYNDKFKHRCSAICSCCYQSPACVVDKLEFCKDCRRYFRNKLCFQHHKKAIGKSLDASCETQSTQNKATSICDRVQRCKKCHKHITNAHKNDHKCGYFVCRICKQETKKQGNICIWYLV